MKAILLAVSTLMVFSVQAEISTTLDLTQANTVICNSDGIGSFSLRNLQTKNPSFNRTRMNPIKIEKVANNSITFKYKEASLRYKLLLTKAVIHQDVDNSRYIAHKGVLINGDIESPVECIVD